MQPTDTRMTFDGLMELIFSKLQVRYGAAWMRQWDGVDMAFVKSDWMRELSGFAGNPAALMYALDHLPERVPNVAKFREIANQMPAPVFERLPAPAANPAVVAEQIARQSGVKQAIGGTADPRLWARILEKRHATGERLSRFQVESYRQALGKEGRMAWQ